MKLSHKTIFTLLLFISVFLFSSVNTHARKITRKADCGKDINCSETFQKHKELWLQCLEAEGLSEKKRKKLSAKVEVLGIRNLKKQEVLIFNSGRKQCHKKFYEALSEIPQNGKGKPDFPLDSSGVLKNFP
jgi:hypothetical protein